MSGLQFSVGARWGDGDRVRRARSQRDRGPSNGVARCVLDREGTAATERGVSVGGAVSVTDIRESASR